MKVIIYVKNYKLFPWKKLVIIDNMEVVPRVGERLMVAKGEHYEVVTVNHYIDVEKAESTSVSVWAQKVKGEYE